jgi:transglutaminase-like putative cysteine protease/tetratricopeptide (TPR) repeat protein
MRSIVVFCALAALGLSISGYPQASQQASADRFAKESLVIERSETTMRMRMDGTGERVVHAMLRIQSQGAVQQFGVLTLSYASAYETPRITLVRVHKPDGTTVDTPADNAIDMPAEVTREAPLYSDLKEKHLPIRSLSVGDTLEYEVHNSIDKPEAPGQFWGANHFTAPGTVIVLAEVFNLEVPKDKYVQVWSPNHKPTVTENDTVRTYSWNVAQLVPAPKSSQGDDAPKEQAPKDPDEDADGRRLPSVAWTTFHTWAEVGDWYKALASERARPTDDLRARANEITKGAKSPAEQVHAIYDFVSSKYRYVGIDFGVGRYQPHDAAEVLANQYGDCKDKDTLLEALLRSKGFTTAPALIGAGIALVPDVPSPALFNHVITTVDLPDGRIWLDSTPGVAPYRYLSAIIRDQKALRIPVSRPAVLEQTPASAPYPFTERFEAVAVLDAEGKLTSKMSATYHDDSELLVRGLARNIAPAEWDKASQYFSAITGFGGTTSNSQFKNVDNPASAIVLTYDYQRHPFGDWDNRRIVPLFPALEFPQLDSVGTAPTEDINLGAPRTMEAVSHIRLPENYRTDLPDPIHVKTDFATFHKTYRFDGKEIVAERTITILKAKVAKADWKTYQHFTKDISLGSEAWIQLIQPTKSIAIQVGKSEPGKKSVPLPVKDGQTVTVHNADTNAEPADPADASSDDPSPGELMQKAGEQLRSGDWPGAKSTLEVVKAKNPDQEFLWGMLGVIAETQRNYDEARSDYQKELAKHPDNVNAAGALAGVEKKSGDTAAAQRTLQSYLDRHPEELRLSILLASYEMGAEDYTAALKTLQSAAEQHPDDRSLRLQLSNALLHLNRNDEAAAAAKSVLDGTDDPLLLNDAAYTLAESGRDLEYAEQMSRKSIGQLEEKSATITTAEVNSKAFASANLLIASWDTLGWILFREAKFDEAKPLLTAAWRNNLSAEVGDHLGQLYEATHNANEACAVYRLADAAANSNTPSDVRKHIHDGYTRLEASGAKPGPKNGSDALQSSRTYKMPHAANLSGWGTFRLEITNDGVIESQQMSGEQKIAPVTGEIKKMKFPELIPPNSKAHLLRSAVVSCSQISGCELVLVPDGGLHTEQR